MLYIHRLNSAINGKKDPDTIKLNCSNKYEKRIVEVIASVIEKVFLKIARIRAKKGKKPNPKPQNSLHLPADLPPVLHEGLK